MFTVVAYDISDDKRRTRLHKALKHFGFAVQGSVFECHLTPSQLWQLKATVAALIDPTIDEVRYYFLCETCARRTETTAASVTTADPPVVIV